MRLPLNRRTFLKASGVSLALPMLESMGASGFRDEAPPQRGVFICTTLGLHPSSLWPSNAGREYETTEYLEILKDHRQEFTLFSGLAHEGQAGRQPHNCEQTWLTSARGPGLDGFKNSISVDQVAASKFGYVTRFPSIVLGSNSQQSQSFTSSGVMIPAQTSPAKLFADLFMQGDAQSIANKKQELSEGRSILDQLGSETESIRRQSSSADNQQLDEYFESIRKAELEISEAEGWLDQPKPSVDAEQPNDVQDRADLVGRTQRLMDLIPLILQTDSSRVVSVMIQDHSVVPTIEGVSAEHHSLSHHGQDPEKIEQLCKIESRLVECFGSLLTQLKSKTEVDGSVLDRTSILFGSNLGNANAHDSRNLPIFVAGGGFSHGQFVHHSIDEEVPLCNLFVTMLNQMGIETDAFGQSTGTLSW